MSKSKPEQGALAGGETTLHQLGLDPQKLAEYTEKLGRKNPDRRICACGHPLIRHEKRPTGNWSCIWGRMWCPCQHPSAVLLAQDVRHFQTKTRGIGERHALATGLHNSLKRGIAVEFAGEPCCYKCGTTSGPLIPIGMTEDAKVIDRPAPFNGIFCKKCAVDLGAMV